MSPKGKKEGSIHCGCRCSQLEVCDLEECDSYKSIEEYEDVGEYEKDLYYTDKLVVVKQKMDYPKD